MTDGKGQEQWPGGGHYSGGMAAAVSWALAQLHNRFACGMHSSSPLTALIQHLPLGPMAVDEGKQAGKRANRFARWQDSQHH